jgi:hypothetical protein
MTNEYPSMQTWQADTYATWAVLGEIVAALGVFDKIDWDRATKSAQAKCGEQMHQFVWASVEGVREAAANAASVKK